MDPQATVARIVAAAARDISARGWTGFFTRLPRFPAFYGYSVGFTRSFAFPEVVVTGLEIDLTNSIIATLAKRLGNGERPAFHTPLDVGLAVPVALRPIPRDTARDLLVFATNFYGSSEFEAVQVVWSDPAGRFPWEAGHRVVSSFQPLLYSDDTSN